jgi:hypothetical protein
MILVAQLKLDNYTALERTDESIRSIFIAFLRHL